MKEGGLAAPTRHPLDWQNPDFYDEAKLDAEMRRIFDICHGCRRCFNLCDSFPRLFDLVDSSQNGELDTVESASFAPVVEACTLCDMCYMTKCPYVPPHEFNLDFPHLMLRYRAVEARKGAVTRADKELAETDRNGKLASVAAPLANWATDAKHETARKLVETVAGLHHEAVLPSYSSESFESLARKNPPTVDSTAPAFGRKAVLYATCYTNYNDPSVGLTARAVLAKNGVRTEVVHPHCCGMPKLEQGLIEDVAAAARIVANSLETYIDLGYDVIALVPSCTLMLKSEWPLILPDDAKVQRLARATYDLSEYIVDIAKKEGLAEGMQPVDGGIALHIACHSRAQNMGRKAADMLRLVPGADVEVIERCSGHGGAWGYKTANFATALKVGAPVARQVETAKKAYVSSECPLAGLHITQGVERLGTEAAPPHLLAHPIELLALAYGIAPRGDVGEARS